MSFAPGLDPGSIVKGAEYLTRPAEEYVNDSNVEALWVRVAVEYADIHFNLICSADPKLLKLTKEDDERIYDRFLYHFTTDFDLDNASVDSLKSPDAISKWREFCEEFKDFEDYNYGTLLRLNSAKEYSEENCILVCRIQFLAVEIARNRKGSNDLVYQSHSHVESNQILS